MDTLSLQSPILTQGIHHSKMKLLITSGQRYAGQNVVGIYLIKKGCALIQRVYGSCSQQRFREGNKSLKPYGKVRKVKYIDKIELKTVYDINNSCLVAEDDYKEFASGDIDFNQVDHSPLFKIN